MPAHPIKIGNILKLKTVKQVIQHFLYFNILHNTPPIKELQALGLDTKVLDKDGNEIELKQDLDDGSGIQPIDEQAFTTVNDFEGQEGFGVENTENEQEAGQSDGFDDLFADNESESDDDFGFDFGDISSDDE